MPIRNVACRFVRYLQSQFCHCPTLKSALPVLRPLGPSLMNTMLFGTTRASPRNDTSFRPNASVRTMHLCDRRTSGQTDHATSTSVAIGGHFHVGVLPPSAPSGSRIFYATPNIKLVFWKKMFVNDNTIVYSLSRVIRDRFAAVASKYGTLSLAQSFLIFVLYLIMYLTFAILCVFYVCYHWRNNK